MKYFLFPVLDGFFILRPIVLIPVWGFCIFGYSRARLAGTGGLPEFWNTADPMSFFLIVVFSLSVGCVYVLNQIADIDIDKMNGGLPLLASGIVSRRSACIAAALAGCISVAVPFFLGRPAMIFFSVITIAIGALYSFRPVYLSGRPFFDFLTNALGAGFIAFGAGWHLAGRSLSDPAFLSAGTPYFLLMCAGSISSTIPDIRGDRDGGKRTTAVALGAKKAHYLATVFIMAAALNSLAVNDLVATACALAPLPLYLLYTMFPSVFLAEATYKIGGAFCMAAAACIMPLFMLCGGAVAIATWMYFRLRHGERYPSLVPHNRHPAAVPAEKQKT
jgi:4-hydroxybenzoate polyprenyltransferase